MKINLFKIITLLCLFSSCVRTECKDCTKLFDTTLSNNELDSIVQTLPKGLAVTDATQAFGKLPLAFNWLGAETALISAHKIGGPKGIGALVLRRGVDLLSQIKGGGQEMGRRAGTENVVAIAGFGAAAEAAATDLATGVWQRVEKIRNILETALFSHLESVL